MKIQFKKNNYTNSLATSYTKKLVKYAKINNRLE